MHTIPQDRDGVVTVLLKDLADAVNRPATSGFAQIRLPSFQRDSVWDPTRIEVFWDSLLRRFPVGTLLLVPHRSIDPDEYGSAVTDKARALSAATRKSHASGGSAFEDGGLLLIDGQQRTLAIALGFREYQPGDRKRLWVDLAAIDEEEEDSTDPTSIRFGLRVTTRAQPWGPRSRLSHCRRAAELCDRSLSDVNRDENSLGYTWPAGAEGRVFPVPFHELRAHVAADGPWSREALVELAPEVLQESLPDVSVRRIGGLRLALQQLLEWKVPVQVVQKTPLWKVQELHLLFQRVNTQGKEMGGDELFFSGIKLYWPESHDLVWDIHDRAGRLLRPTGVVHLATRLAVSGLAELKREDVPRLNLKVFKRLVHEDDPAQRERFIGKLEEVLRKPENPNRGLGTILSKARKLLGYRGGDDPGLPTPLLAKLDWRIWHTLAGWLDAAGDRPGNLESSRAEILRYVAMHHFFVEVARSQRIITLPMAIARKAPGMFPGRDIYQRLRDEDPTWLKMEGIPEPQRYASEVGTPENSEWRGKILRNERDLLLWMQREWVERWFKDYDPTQLANSKDRPYDIDHILPWASFDRRGRSPGEDVPDRFKPAKWKIANAVGNRRIWPKSANRADGSRGLADKGLLGEADVPVAPKLSWLRKRPLGFHTYREVRRASLMKEENLELWKRANSIDGDAKRWNEDRLSAMIRVMLSRRHRIYREFFEGFEFRVWHEHEASTERGR